MNIFETVIENNVVSIGSFFICIISALIAGFAFHGCATINHIHQKASLYLQHFYQFV